MSASLITKKALANSLKDLMSKKPLNKISVQNIVDTCGVNRQTFYYHFQDIYDLLGWIYKIEAVENLNSCTNYENWTDGFYKIFIYIKKNKGFCTNTLNSLGRSHLDQYLYEITDNLIIKVVNEIASDMKVKEDDKKFIANFYTVAFTGLVIQWMKDNMKEDPKVIIEKLRELVEGSIVKALERYSKA